MQMASGQATPKRYSLDIEAAGQLVQMASAAQQIVSRRSERKPSLVKDYYSVNALPSPDAPPRHEEEKQRDH